MREKFGETFLTKARWTTTDAKWATHSFWVWRFEKQGAWYALAWIGVINGCLNKVGLVLCANVEKETNEIAGYVIKKKWW